MVFNLDTFNFTIMRNSLSALTFATGIAACEPTMVSIDPIEPETTSIQSNANYSLAKIMAEKGYEAQSKDDQIDRDRLMYNQPVRSASEKQKASDAIRTEMATASGSGTAFIEECVKKGPSAPTTSSLSEVLLGAGIEATCTPLSLTVKPVSGFTQGWAGEVHFTKDSQVIRTNIPSFTAKKEDKAE